MEIKGDSMMKKIIAVLLTLAMIPLGICSASALEDNSSFYMSGSDLQKNLNVIGAKTVEDDFILIKKSSAHTIDAKLMFKNVDTARTLSFDVNAYTNATMARVTDSLYEETISTSWVDVTESKNRDFNNTGGIYHLARIKMSAFDKRFNDDGTYTKTLFNDTHNYNFTKENDNYASVIVFKSGSAYTVATPDSHGIYEVYLGANIGDTLEYTAIFSHDYDNGEAFTADTQPNELNELITIGDTNRDAKVDINDATLIQKYLVGLADIDALQVRNSNVLLDGKLDVMDATTIQKHLVSK